MGGTEADAPGELPNTNHREPPVKAAIVLNLKSRIGDAET
jgi:hypothetical protein